MCAKRSKGRSTVALLDVERDEGSLRWPYGDRSNDWAARPFDNSWLDEVLAPLAVRRHLLAGTCLFAAGDKAAHYYLVERGRLVVRRSPLSRGPVERIASEGELIIYDCDGTHAADCHADVDSTVLAVERRRVEFRAMLEPSLRGVLNAVHAAELGMILQSLGVDHARVARGRGALERTPCLPTLDRPGAGRRGRMGLAGPARAA